jgi:hypothetical protein
MAVPRQRRKTVIPQTAAEAVDMPPASPAGPQLTEIVPLQPPEPPQLSTQHAEAARPARQPLADSDRDPREWKSINLGPEKNSPRLRLLRSDRFNQMQIRADEELPAAALERLKSAGWTERPEEGIWTRQLPSRKKEEGVEPTPPWPTVLEAERLLHDLANDIRTGKGMPPIAHESGR